MSEDPQHTLGAVPARLEAREQQIAEQVGAAHEKIAELTALLSELDQATEYIKITRKTLLELPDEASPPTPAPTTTVPDNAAYRLILAALAEAEVRCGHGTPARRWTWRWCRTTSTTPAPSSSAWSAAAS